jgi:hypothetical protein
MKTLTLIISAMFLVACGDSGDDAPAPSLYSKWSQVSGFDNGAYDWTMDLRDVDLGIVTIGYASPGFLQTDRCTCDIQITSKRTFEVSNCQAIGGFNCNNQQGKHVYKLSGHTLETCQPNATCIGDTKSTCFDPAYCIKFEVK